MNEACWTDSASWQIVEDQGAGVAWFGLVWFGLAWPGLNVTKRRDRPEQGAGVAWFGLAWPGLNETKRRDRPDHGAGVGATEA